MVAQDLVVTAAHVVEGANTVSVLNDEGISEAEILGVDPGTDVALLRTVDARAASSLAVASEDPAQGSDVLVMGYPLGVWDLRNTSGGITSGLTSVSYPEQRVEPAVMSDADTNVGYSGGPALSPAGEVVGLVSGGRYFDASRLPVDGEKYLAPASSIAAGIEAWQDAEPQPLDTCGDPEGQGPDQPYDLDMVLVTDEPVAASAAQTLYGHGQGINLGDYAAAHALFTSDAQGRYPLQEWSSGLTTSYWERLEVLRASGTGEGQITLRVLLTTAQDPEVREDGATCTIYGMDYTLKADQTAWLIDSVAEFRDLQTC